MSNQLSYQVMHQRMVEGSGTFVPPDDMHRAHFRANASGLKQNHATSAVLPAQSAQVRSTPAATVGTPQSSDQVTEASVRRK